MWKCEQKRQRRDMALWRTRDKSEHCSPQGSDPALLHPLAQRGDALDGVLAVAIVVNTTEAVAVQAAAVKEQQRLGRATSPNVARPADLGQKGTLLLAHLREERLGSFGRTAMIASSPSIFQS